MSDVDQLKTAICDVGRRMYERGLVVARDGNITVRIGDDEILSTPTMVCKGRMQSEDMCLVNLRGERIGGCRRPTSELQVHLEIYRNRPDVHAVVHCHPPHVLAFCLTNRELPRYVLAEVEVLLGKVPVVPYATPGTRELAMSIVPFLDRAQALVLAHHGTVTLADELETAYWRSEVLDHYCRVLLLAHPLGTPQQLPREYHAALRKLGGAADACLQHRSHV